MYNSAWFPIAIAPLVFALVQEAVENTGPTRAASAPGESSAADDPSVETLTSDDVASRRTAFSQLARRKSQLEATLLKIANEPLGGKTANESQLMAIRLLAKMPSPDTITFFVKNIECAHAVDVFSPSELNGYPCAIALRDIGLSSLPAIFRALQSSDPQDVSDEAIFLYAHILSDTCAKLDDRDADGEAISIVERQHSRAHFKENLSRLLGQLKEFHRDPKNKFRKKI